MNYQNASKINKKNVPLFKCHITTMFCWKLVYIQLKKASAHVCLKQKDGWQWIVYRCAIWQQHHYELSFKISSGYSWQGVNLLDFMVGARTTAITLGAWNYGFILWNEILLFYLSNVSKVNEQTTAPLYLWQKAYFLMKEQCSWT